MKLFFTTIFTACFLFLGVPTYAANIYNPPATIEDIKQLRNDLNERIDQNNETTTKLYDGVVTQQSMMADSIGKQMDGIGLQIAQSEKNLSLIGSILTILGIFLGILVDRKHEQVTAIEKTIKNTAAIVETKKIEIEEFLKNKSTDLFNKMQRADTQEILKNLVKVPQNIVHYENILITRQLESLDFFLLKQAFLTLPQKEKDNHIYTTPYLICFLNHFTPQSLQDPEISSFIISKITISPRRRGVITLTHFNKFWDHEFDAFISDFSSFINFVYNSHNTLTLHNQDLIIEIFYSISLSKYSDKTHEICAALHSKNINIASLLTALPVNSKAQEDPGFANWLFLLNDPQPLIGQNS